MVLRSTACVDVSAGKLHICFPRPCEREGVFFVAMRFEDGAGVCRKIVRGQCVRATLVPTSLCKVEVRQLMKTTETQWFKQ